MPDKSHAAAPRNQCWRGEMRAKAYLKRGDITEEQFLAIEQRELQSQELRRNLAQKCQVCGKYRVRTQCSSVENGSASDVWELNRESAVEKSRRTLYER